MSKELQSLPLLRDLVGFDTTSRNPNRPLIEYVCDYLRQFGVEPELICNDQDTKANLWATIGPADRPGIILSGHTMRGRLEEAAAIARAAESCAREGQPARAFTIALDVEPLAVEANQLLQGLAILNRIELNESGAIIDVRCG